MPIYTVKATRGGSKYAKNQANKKVRKEMFFYRKSKKYKRIYESWNIVDYRFYKRKPLETEGEFLRIWEKFYYRK